MQKLLFAATLAAFGCLAHGASAATVLNTTQQDVKDQCGGKTNCLTSCGSTLCDYVCDDPKKQCTVAIFLKKAPKGRLTSTNTVGQSLDRR